MPLVTINADEPLPPRLTALAAGLPEGAPLIFMLHGYGFSPRRHAHSPHAHILSLTPRKHRSARSWPRALGFGTGAPDEGLAIAFGWEARGRLHEAYARADEVGVALACAITRLARAARRPVGVIAHSLGARVALAALRALPADAAGAVGRVILLSAAEFRGPALAALDAPGARGTEVFNITTRENDLFDFAMERWLGAPRGSALGHGLGGHGPGPHGQGGGRRNWLDIQIDDPATLTALAGLGHLVQGAPARVSHYSPYLRPGLFGLYRMLLRRPGEMPLPWLAELLPAEQAPRWSRLRAPLDGVISALRHRPVAARTGRTAPPAP
ncbi:alpha/beta hydrolase [Phaeovulum vinaykumarii]|uniref:Uncharacterized protein n=1 Tax=Phaeovulum vinaykumarii TaxID=407234 RepID=A0A1N7L6T8_9RHOB|nr:alpha/beta hydrolase [Phaeovulum vinaykumarii]SIS69410.1 Alpha/beta hydrolase of unknown function [Phaeovulum vinaykumarii]SOB99504.1 alpha/beta hydrolase family protein DUF900 [Phaeovulum vinaykumarii]